MSLVSEVWRILGEMSPYLLFGFFAAGILSQFLSAETVERHLGGAGWRPVVKAALWGVPMPLCSCSVIPVAASLRRRGAGRQALAAFLLSTPQTGVDSVLVTYALLGPFLAIFRPIAAFVTGIVGGLIMRTDNAKRPPVEAGETCPECSHAGEMGRGRLGGLRMALRYGFLTLPADMGLELLIGLLVAGLITAIVPDDFFVGHMGSAILPMLMMIAVGIPIYVCATASVPIAAALIIKGLSPGAAFVFLMTGPATNAAALAAFRNILGWRGMFIFILTVAGMALFWGIVLDCLLSGYELVPAGGAGVMLPAFVRNLSAVILLMVLGHALLRRNRVLHHESAAHQ